MTAIAGQPTGGRSGGPMLRGIPNLSDTQRADVAALVERHRSTYGDEMKALGELRQQLHTELFADSPNPATIEDLKAKIVAAQQSALDREIELQSEIARLLTPDQRAAARDRGARGFGLFGGGRRFRP